jgi:hypothetical protein
MSKAEVVTQSLTLPFDGIKLIDILKLELGLWVDDSASMSVCGDALYGKSVLHRKGIKEHLKTAGGLHAWLQNLSFT